MNIYYWKCHKSFFILLHFSIKDIFSWNKDDFISLVSTLFHRRVDYFFLLSSVFFSYAFNFPSLFIYLFILLGAQLSPATLFIYISLKVLLYEGGYTCDKSELFLKFKLDHYVLRFLQWNENHFKCIMLSLLTDLLNWIVGPTHSEVCSLVFPVPSIYLGYFYD